MFDTLILTVPEVAKMLRVSKSYIYKQTSQNKLPCHRVGTKIFFFENEILDFYFGSQLKKA